MRKIKIFDTTLRDGEQSPGCSMNINEKAVIAKKLDEAGVDIIEAGFAASNERDFKAIEAISKVVENTVVTSLARCNKNDIDLAYESIKKAKHKRIHIFIATSDIHLKSKLNKTREEVEIITKEMVSYAKSKCDDIEFSLEDATRTDKDYACKIIDIAIENGATTINIPDTVGYMLPSEFKEFIEYLKKHSNLNKVDISVHCHNDLGLATANSVMAVENGVNQVECTINGIGERAGNAALEEIVACIDNRKDYFDCYTNFDTTKIYELSNIVQNFTGSFVQNNKAIVGGNAGLHEAGIHQAGVTSDPSTYESIDLRKYGVYKDNIVIGIHSGKAAIINKMTKLGFNMNDYDVVMITKQIKKWFEENENQKFTDEIFKSIVEENKNRRQILTI